MVTALIFPFNAVAVAEHRPLLSLTLLLCRARSHQSVNLICLSVQPACLCGTACSMCFILSGDDSVCNTAHLVGTTGTLEPKRGLDLLFSYVMSESCLFVYFQKTQIKEYEESKGFSP